MGCSVKTKAWFLLVLICLKDVLCVHEWKLSEDGKRIEAVLESPFNLHYPGSLLDFLRQADDLKAFGRSYKELDQTMSSITKREKLDEPGIEDRVRRENAHCQRAADLKITKELFKSTYSLEMCTDYAVLNQEYISELKTTSLPSSAETEPHCSKHFKKAVFPGEKEQGIGLLDTRMSTSRHPDPEYARTLANYLDFRSKPMKEIGSYLGRMLSWTEKKAISHHPYLHMMAAAYWRSGGNLNEALDCYRTASTVLRTGDHDPRYRAYMEQTIQIAAVTLLNYGEKTEEAVKLVAWLSEMSQPLNDPFCRLTIILAVSADVLLSTGELPNTSLTLSNIWEAAKEYGEAVTTETKLLEKDRKAIKDWDQVMKSIKDKHAALTCQFDITKELEKQQENLEGLLHEKLHYNAVVGKRVTTEMTILSRMADDDVRLRQKFSYELAKYGWNPFRSCSSEKAKRFPFSNNPKSFASTMACNAKDRGGYEAFLMAKRKDTLANRPPLNDTVWRLAELFPRDKNFEKKVKQAKGSQSFDAVLGKKYPLKLAGKERYWRRTDWPNSVDCQATVSKTDIFSPKNMPQLFISPEDKGYIVSDLLTKHLGLDHSEDHPLPWNEPFCERTKMEANPFSPYSSIKALIEMKGFKAEFAETQLKTVLTRLADKVMDMAEVGQRIRTLMENNIGPRWLVLNLAALYWRVKGYPSQATFCLMESTLITPGQSDLALFQLAQVVFKATENREEALEFLNMAAGVDREHPYLNWLQGRLELLLSDVDGALNHLKEAMDSGTGERRIAEDLLKVACSGKTTKPAIKSLFPTICCSEKEKNVVCFNLKHLDKCFKVDSETKSQLVYERCYGKYDKVTYITPPLVHIFSPFLSIFQTVERKSDIPVSVEAGQLEFVDSGVELPLDYGGTGLFFAPRPQEWWSRSVNEMKYVTVSRQERLDNWEEAAESTLAAIPPKPLSFLWIKNMEQMLEWDVKLPESLPAPPDKLIRKGLEVFPPPRHTSTLCNGISKLTVLLEKQVSTWVSVTAKGIDIEKYVDLRGPVPGIAGLQPVCPTFESTDGSPILGLEHIPIFALSDQFLFYKPEKMLSDSLKSLGNERDTIEHVAARLHTAMLANAIQQHGDNVNWLLCVLSSLYWRVVGDAPKAVGCLQCALQTAPPQMRDVALVSLANIAHQAGLLHSALIAAGAALSVSPNLVAIHFTLGNIYASIGDHQRALEFYYSTLALQYNLEPAKERIRAIYCHSSDAFTFQSP